MAKNKDSIKKIVGKKKINRYSKDQCISEIARLEKGQENKKGVSIPDANSRYQEDIRKRLASLS